MKIHQASASVKTPGRVGVENVTRLVTAEVEASGIRQGFVLVTVLHTTCGLAVNEDEPGLVSDITRLAATILDPVAEQGPFHHDRIDNNARAHLTSLLLGPSLHLPVAGAKLVLGRWQSVFLIEMDGPRTRGISIQVMGY